MGAANNKHRKQYGKCRSIMPTLSMFFFDFVQSNFLRFSLSVLEKKRNFDTVFRPTVRKASLEVNQPVMGAAKADKAFLGRCK